MQSCKMKKFPWVSACAFLSMVIGYTATVNEFPGYEYRYACLLIVTVLLIRLVEMRFVHVPSVDIPLWISGLVIFSSYYLKFFLIAVDPSSPVRMGMLTTLTVPDPFISLALVKALAPTLIFDWSATQIISLSLCTLGVVGWSLTVFLIPTLKINNISKISTLKTSFLVEVTFVIAILLSIVIAWASYKYDIGVMGKNVSDILPMHLRGIIFHLNNYFLPGLILMVIALAYKSTKNLILVLGVVLLFMNGFINFVITSSKSVILWPALLVLFLVVTSGIKIGYRYIVGAFSGMLAILLFLPYMHAIRAARIAGTGGWESLLVAASSAKFEPFTLIIKSITWIIYRLPGIDIVAAIFGHHGAPLGNRVFEVLMSKNGVSGYLTNDIFLIPASYPHMNAPGYWGWWYLVLGLPGVLLGGVFLGLFIRLLWPLVLISRLETAPLLKVYTLMILFTAVSEGTIDSMFKIVIAMLGTIIFLELYIKYFTLWCDKTFFQITKVFGTK